MKRYHSLLFLVLAVSVLRCSTVKQNDPAKEARIFIDQFGKNLAATDDVIMSQFKLAPDLGVTREGVLKAIRIMQNHDQTHDSVVCTINFQDVYFFNDGPTIRVDITAQFTALDTVLNMEKKSGFKFWLSTLDDQLFITNLEAEEFYFDYKGAVRDQQSRKNREQDIATRKIFFEQARRLQQTYDSVIWYTQYKDSIYYYVVNGKWDNYFLHDAPPCDSVKMGLVSESGRVIVPTEYDLVGTIGFEQNEVIEVKKNGRVGHFDIEGNVMVPAAYDWIVPYQHENIYALVRQDSIYGWIDARYSYHAGFPSVDAEKYIREFHYLDEFKVVSSSTTTMTELLSTDDIGYGIVIPTRHFVLNGILTDVVPYLYLNGSDWGGTEKIETQKTFFENITDNLSAVIVHLTEYYVEGREGFYSRNNLNFVNREGVIVNSFVIGSNEMQINRIDSTLLEASQNISIDLSKVVSYEEVEALQGHLHRPFYKYYRLEGTEVTEIESHRRFEFTALIKMDSSYIAGKFMTYTEEEDSEFFAYALLPARDIRRMRDEILAEYGYIFTNPEDSRSYVQQKWYNPRFQHYGEFLDSMTEIDRYNLEFLERIIGTRNVPAS